MATPPLYQLFADQVTANPDVLALDGPGGAYTYQQLSQWSDCSVGSCVSAAAGRVSWSR